MGPQGEDGLPGEAGPAGADGPPGKDGYSPVRGVDYWTEADVQAMLAALSSANGSGITIYINPNKIPIKSGMQIIYYANSAGTMQLTMGNATYKKDVTGSNDVTWMLWLQTGDTDGSFIFPAGSRNYLLTGYTVEEATVTWKASVTSPKCVVVTIE